MLGDIPLRNLTPGLIQLAYAELLEAGLSKRTVEQTPAVPILGRPHLSMARSVIAEECPPSDMTGRLEQLRAVGPAWRDA